MNRGAEKLKRIAERRKLKQKDIAAETGFDEPRVSRLLSGKIVPNRREGLVLREKYKIDPALWDEAAEESQKGAA